MNLNFEYDLDKKKIIFYGNGFEVSAKAETYEEVAEFAKTVIEHDILVPGLRHEKETGLTEQEKQKFYPILLYLISALSLSKPAQWNYNYYVKDPVTIYDVETI